MKEIISGCLGLPLQGVSGVVELLGEGATVPFIARYRKERTGGMNEVDIARISQELTRLQELEKRKQTVLSTIDAQGKLTDALRRQIEATWDGNQLEDLYLPFKPRRRTRAQVAREQGLEPLATLIMMGRERNPEAAAEQYVGEEVKSVAEALQGAQDILAEMVSEDADVRERLRRLFERKAILRSRIRRGMKEKDEAQKFSDYFEWEEQLRRCPSHRMLAMRRGEHEGVLGLSVVLEDEDEAVAGIVRRYVHTQQPACARLLEAAIADAYKRLLAPQMESEMMRLGKEKADTEAVRVFAGNLSQLLMGAPLGEQRVLAIDPGFRTGCKVVCLGEHGDLLSHFVIKPHTGDESGAARQIAQAVRKYRIEAIAVGNGTASRETTAFLDRMQAAGNALPPVFVVSEDGASIYSASEVAREEFPSEDVTVRGAVSIGRRLMDPLSELVKLPPESIGVGQYQHDVDQGLLRRQLDQTVVSCVNRVGVDLNTASRHLLTYVSGLGPALARNIVDYRTANGAFSSRRQLLKVARLGPTAYEQCAGFLRIRGAKNPLDNSAVHPERYALVEQMAKDAGCSVAQLMQSAEKRKSIRLEQYQTPEIGMPTLLDIMNELEKPGRDPREQLEAFRFDPTVHTPQDLRPGMLLPGIVTNITQFGAFVDVGVHQDGLVHVSQLANRFVKDPTQVVSLHQHVRVRVLEVDLRRNRISLSMREE
ncbi:MAG: Tex family protein [Bacteroidaceae bacterium]|nr:Tex family protein [Bacteroidaceae bacterium]